MFHSFASAGSRTVFTVHTELTFLVPIAAAAAPGRKIKSQLSHPTNIERVIDFLQVQIISD